MAIVAYCRVSTDGQTESGLGLEAQRAAIISNFGEPAAWFEDAGISGSRADRPGLLAALDALKRGDVLAVAKRDRLARDMFLSLYLEREVEKKGARIQAADGNGNGTDPAEVLMRRMLEAFSEFERGIIRARTKAGLAAKRARGEKTGGTRCPYGYRIGGYREVERRGAKVRIPLLEEVPEEQVNILVARALRAKGYGWRAVAKKCGWSQATTARRICLREGT